MSYYRTYRPQTLDEIDNSSVRDQLILLLNKDRKELPHAFFLTGPRGTGKTTSARLIAKLFNCEKLKKTGPCGDCDMCKAIANGTNMDVLEIDAASNRGIEEIRELRQRIGLAPVSSAFKIYIIDEVHMLTNEAFNALLKTLEEPPAHAVFILATTDPQKVPATILSRCVHIAFHRANAEELLHGLKRIVAAEKITIADNALARVAEIADGSFRDAAKLLEQMSFRKGEITLTQVNDTLTVTDSAFRDAFLSHLAAKDLGAALSDIAEFQKAGSDSKSFLVDVLGALETLLLSAAAGKPKAPWTMTDLLRVIGIFTRAYGELRISPVPELPLELAVIDYCTGKTESVPPSAVTPVKAAQNVAAQKPAVKPEVPTKPVSPPPTQETQPQAAAPSTPAERQPADPVGLGTLTMEKLVEHWPDFIIAMKPNNHSVAGVLRSSRPKAVEGGIVTIEAFYKFHQEKLSENLVRQQLADVLKKLFGEKVKVEIVLGKK